MSLYVYILELSNDRFYTGVTNNIHRRLIEHQNGINPKAYTFSKRPVKLVYHEEYSDYNLAIRREKQIKNWSHAKKRALVNGDYEVLKKLSKSSSTGSE